MMKLVISTTLLIGRMPLEARQRCIHFGEGPIFTFFTTLAVYRGQREGSSTLTLT